MFQAVIVFGAATVVFALSRSVLLSLAALGIAGAADTISVVIRISLVQLGTPDAMRGRVGAVKCRRHAAFEFAKLVRRVDERCLRPCSAALGRSLSLCSG